MESGVGAEKGYRKSTQYLHRISSFDPTDGTPFDGRTTASAQANFVPFDVSARDGDGEFLFHDGTALERTRQRVEEEHPWLHKASWTHTFPERRSAAATPDHWGRCRYVNAPGSATISYEIDDEGNDVLHLSVTCDHRDCGRFNVVDLVGQKSANSEHVKFSFICPRGVLHQFCSCITTVDGFQAGSTNECTKGSVAAPVRCGFFAEQCHAAAEFAFAIAERNGSAPLGVPPKFDEPDPFAGNPCRGIIHGCPEPKGLEPSDLPGFIAGLDAKIGAAKAELAKGGARAPIEHSADIQAQRIVPLRHDLQLPKERLSPATSTASDATGIVDCEVQGDTHPVTRNSCTGCLWWRPPARPQEGGKSRLRFLPVGSSTRSSTLFSASHGRKDLGCTGPWEPGWAPQDLAGALFSAFLFVLLFSSSCLCLCLFFV